MEPHGSVSASGKQSRRAYLAGKTMNMQEKRSIALGAVRSQLRRLGIPIDQSVSFDNVLGVLNDLYLSEPDLIASQWYITASDYQITQLRRDWKRQFPPTRRRSTLHRQKQS